MNNEKKKGSKKWLIIVAIVVVLAAIVFALTGFITDIIWFNEVGYTSVFLTEIFTKIKFGIPTFIIVSLVSFFVLSILKNNFLIVINCAESIVTHNLYNKAECSLK